MRLLESYLFDTFAGGINIDGPSYRSRFQSFASVRDLEQYFAGQSFLFQWIGAIAVFPVPQWQVTLRVGEIVETYYRKKGQSIALVTYTNLLKLSRIPWMQDGNWPESLKADLLATIDKDLQAAVRAGLNDEVARMIASLPERSVARVELTDYFRLNKFLLDAYGGRRVSEREFFAVKHLLDSDQVDAAHKIYLDRGENSMLPCPGKTGKAETLDRFQDFATRPAKRKLLLEALAILVVLATCIFTLLALRSSRLLQWKTTSPVDKSLSFTQQLDRPRTLYADLILGDDAERIAFTADTSILFRNIKVRDSSDQVYFRISADTNSLTVASYDSLPFEKFSDTIIAIAPRAVPVSIISSDAGGAVIADSLEQALPANFEVTRVQSSQAESNMSLAFYDTSFAMETRQLQTIIRNVLKKDAPIRTLSAPAKTPGINVFVGVYTQSQNIAPKPTKGKGPDVSKPAGPTEPTSLPPNGENPDTSVVQPRDTSTYLKMTPAIRASRLISRGQERYNAGDYRQSLLYYDTAILLNPKDALPYFYRGQSNERLQALDEALRDYETAVNINPNDVQSLFRKAEIEYSQQSYSNANQDYSRIIQMKSAPQNTLASAYYKRGEAYRLTNDLSKACEDYQAASKLGVSQATTAVSNYCSTSGNTTNRILWYDTYTSATGVARERVESSGASITLTNNIDAISKALASKGQLIVYAVNSAGDLKELDYVLAIQSKADAPFIVYYSDYASKLARSNLQISSKQVRVARNDKELLTAIQEFLKPPSRNSYQPQRQSKY